MEMTYVYREEREGYDAAHGLEQLLGELGPGDCLVVERLSSVAKSLKELVSLLDALEERRIRFRSIEEDFDNVSEEGRFAIKILGCAARLEAESRAAGQEAHTKGRKPIEVDEEMFDSILQRWKNGEITARQAMNELNLKPNTFYRRVKERDTKAAESLFDAAKRFGKDIVTSVQESTEEFQQAAGKFASECDFDSLSEAVRKNVTAAGMVLGQHIDSLSRDFQDAVEKFEKKKAGQAEKQAQEPVAEEPREEEVPQEPVQTEPEAQAQSEEPIQAEPEEPVQAEPEEPVQAEPAREAPEVSETNPTEYL